MHIHTLHRWKHSHRFNVEDAHGERNTRWVILLTLSMMIIAIPARYLFGSMALLADALTFLLAIVALSAGKAFGWIWIDPIMGIVGARHLSAIVSIVTHYPNSPDYYKNLLAAYDEIAHVTVEVNPCDSEPCIIQPEPAV